jgi:HPt (histidine-containing phosphotransfer) domain-containing protein
VVELIDLFLEQVAPILAELRSAAHVDDVQVVARIAHTLQSSAGNLGARRLQRLCADVETAARGDVDDGALDDVVTELGVELERVVSALEAERRRSAA